MVASDQDTSKGLRTRAGMQVQVANRLDLCSVPLAAFVLYLLSSSILETSGGTELFGADSDIYRWLADGNAVDRITRFHPLTTVLVWFWMKAITPLTTFVSSHLLLKGLFAAVGAVGVWAAIWAFAAVVPRRYVPLWGVIYATSLGIWYFSSIEESKVISATLIALYIAIYLHLRAEWTVRGAVYLTTTLLLACLNGIDAGLLVVIPVVDTLLQRGWDLHKNFWVILHASAVVLALLVLELIVNGGFVPPGTEPEGASHASMILYYLANNDYSVANAYSFLVNWLFFNIAAPPADGALLPQWPTASALFEPKLANYLLSPITAVLVAMFGVMLVVSLLPRYRNECAKMLPGILLPLFAYVLLRGAIFYVLNPFECLLYSPGTTLAYLLLIAVPFTNSSFPVKQTVLSLCAVLLFVTNGAFIVWSPPLVSGGP